MNELERLEAMLRGRPASLSNEQRRAAYEALGDLFPLAADVRVEPVGALGAIFVGATEALLDDAVALARAAGLADVGVRLEIWPKMFHIWPNYHPVLAQGRQGVARAGRLLREAVKAASSGSD